MSVAVLLLAAASPAVAQIPATQRSNPVSAATARATVRIIRGERIDATAPIRKGDPRISTRRDKQGTRWIEFS